MPEYQLHHGDCLDVLPTLKAGSVAAVVTDPPYGVNLGKTIGRGGSHGKKLRGYSSYDDSYENFVNLIVPRLAASLASATRGAVFTGPHIWEQPKADAIGGVYCPAGQGRHRWGFKTFLPVLFYGTAPDLNKGAKPNTIRSSARPEKNGHPCPKPLEWMEWLVKLTTREGETVFDPFMGSGTTGVACIRTGRRFIGCEIDPAYHAIATNRIESERAKTPMFADAG